MKIRTVLAVTALVAAALAGCATDDASPGGTEPGDVTTPGDVGAGPGDTPDLSGTELQVGVGVVDGDRRTAIEPTWTVTCDPVGGTHPDAEAVCELLATEGMSLFEPVPGDAVCTEIYGGPEVARVTGTLSGEPVDATFSRTNGCEIDRWDAAALLIGGPGL